TQRLIKTDALLSIRLLRPNTEFADIRVCPCVVDRRMSRDRHGDKAQAMYNWYRYSRQRANSGSLRTAGAIRAYGSCSVTSRTAVYGPVCTLVWQRVAGDCRPYDDQTRL
ncbi:MAG TPA: hypothetical protein VIJ38_06425, partial [Acidobacteriaceae bacterium]